MDPLHEGEQLAFEVITRLESGEPLSRVLPQARRLADTYGQKDAAFWLYMESVGSQTARRDWSTMSEDEREGFRRFMRGRQTINVAKVAKTLGPYMPKVPEARDHIASTSIAELERMERPAKLVGPVYDEGAARLWATAELTYGETQRVLEVVRTNVHRFATAMHQLLRGLRMQLELFGPDSFTVLQAGGPLLVELAGCAETLQRSGASIAAQQARTTILRIGRELYAGPAEHISPIDTSKHDTTKGEMNKTRAFLDDLWMRTVDPRRKDLLRTAMNEVEEAYELGSKGKDPTAITYAEALRAIQLTFNVAKTIMLCGGFPIAAATAPTTRDDDAQSDGASAVPTGRSGQT